jgi:Mg-chelatase subunit ChlD
MISWAIRKKFLIISIVVLVILVGFVGGYELFLKKPPSCFDGVQNGNELGVDCGGSCAKLCSTEVKNPIMRWDPRVFKVSDGNYSVLVYFENQNVNAVVLNAPYTIHLLSQTGAVIEERKGTISIPKHTTFAILETGFSSPKVVPSKADFSWDSALNWQRDDSPVPDISVDNKSLTSADTKPRIDATVSNKSLSNIPALELIAIVTDGAGNAVGASKTIVKDFSSGQTVPITFTWPEPFVTTQTVCQSPVDTVLLIDRSGSMSSISATPPEPLTDVKLAAENFLSALQTEDKVAVISFANTGSDPADFPLSFDKNSGKSAVEAIAIDPKGTQNTNIADAFSKARAILESVVDPARKQVVVLLTDGVPTLPTKTGVPEFPQISAQDESRKLQDENVSIFTIGLGNQIDSQFLTSISSTKDDYFQAPTASTLQSIYSSIATQICEKKPAQIDIIPRETENTGL